jgi:hypothetical protein
MSSISRRSMLKSACGIGALLALPAAELFAQTEPRFVPLRLNGRGQAQLNGRVSALDTHEDQLLDDLLGSNVNGERRDLGIIDDDINQLIANPGNPININPSDFRREGLRIHDQIGIVLGASLSRQSIFGVVQMIDFFVGHWYPCNDIVEIGTCEQKIWSSFGGGGNLQIVEFYSVHMRYEMESIFRFHGRGGAFGRQTAGLIGVLDRVTGLARRGDFGACQAEYMRLTMATDLVFRKYYPDWCGGPA